MAKLRLLTSRVNPSTPTKAALPTSACKVVQRRGTSPAVTSAGVSDSPSTAKPKLTSVRFKPMALACPPLTPAKAFKPLAPINNMSTVTGVADSSTSPVAAMSASVTCPVFFSIPKPPDTCTKPNTSRFRLPVARVNTPSAASKLKVRLLGLASVPVLISRPCAL